MIKHNKKTNKTKRTQEFFDFFKKNACKLIERHQKMKNSLRMPGFFMWFLYKSFLDHQKIRGGIPCFVDFGRLFCCVFVVFCFVLLCFSKGLTIWEKR